MTKKTYERPVIRSLNNGIINKFGSRTEYAPVTHIDGVPVKKIMEEYGSPVFVFSESKIRENIRAAKRAFEARYPKVQFAWSYKTNYINAICNIFHQEGSWAEVVSRFEYDKAIANGVLGEHVIFNGPEKTKEDLEVAIKNNSLIHIDHFDELYHLSEIAKKSDKKPRVAIRVNMDTGVYPIWDRFGFNYESGQAWDAINKIVAGGNMELVGLHAHIGTYMMATSAYSVAARKLADLALGVKKKFGFNITYLDLGGGFASQNTLKGSYLSGMDTVPSISEYADAICSTLLDCGFQNNELPVLFLETGRALIDNAGYLLGSVVANKRLSDGRKATILDFGVNLLFTSFWYDHKISPAQEFGVHTEDTVLYGPLCMNIDVVREHISLPPLNTGDNVVVHYVGAYTITQSMQFISLRPPVVLINVAGKVELIKTGDTLKTIEQNEILPDHLAHTNLLPC